MINFANFFKKQKKPGTTIGLDIGAYSIKALEVKTGTDDGFEILKFGVEKITDKPSSETRAEAIKRLFEREGITGEAVNVSVSGPMTITRFVNMPKMTVDELKNALEYEAERYIPFEIKDVYLDSDILLENVEGNKVRTIVAASKREVVDRKLEALKKAGLFAVIMDMDCLALTNAFCRSKNAQKDQVNALLNIGHSLTQVTILKDGALDFVRELQIGGADFAPEKFMNQVRLSFDYYENQVGRAVNKIYTSGGGSMIEGVGAKLNEALGVETSPWDPFKQMKMAAGLKEEALKEAVPLLAVAAGLAMR